MFDTNILIDYFNGVEAPRVEVERYERPAISVISWIEVLVGAKAGLEAATRKFLSSFGRVELTERIADNAVLIRPGREDQRPGRDHLASARIENLMLVTRNTKDFTADAPGIGVPYRL